MVIFKMIGKGNVLTWNWLFIGYWLLGAVNVMDGRKINIFGADIGELEVWGICGG